MKKERTKYFEYIEDCVDKHKNNPTPAESLMEAKLRMNGFKFQREYAILTEKSFFTADFYIPVHGLIIEIDGFYHCSKTQIEKDTIKDIVYKSFGYNVLRIKNNEVEFFDTNFIKKYKRKLILQQNVYTHCRSSPKRTK